MRQHAQVGASRKIICAYIDLNPLAAEIAAFPEMSQHTSVWERVEHVKAELRTED